VLKILLLERDDMFAEDTKILLEDPDVSYSHQVTWLKSGIEAKVLLSKPHGFDCILTDVILEGADGIEAIKSLRSWDKNTPVIVITCSQIKLVAPAYEKAGATMVVDKIDYCGENLPQLIQQICNPKP